MSQIVEPVDPDRIFLITAVQKPNELYVAKRVHWTWREDGHWRIYWEHLLIGSSIDWEVVGLQRKQERLFVQALDGTIYDAKPLTHSLYLERVAPLMSNPPLLANDDEVQSYFQSYTPPSKNQEELKRGLEKAILEMIKKKTL